MYCSALKSTSFKFDQRASDRFEPNRLQIGAKMSKNYFLSNFFPSRSRNFLPQIEAQCLQMLLFALFLHSSTAILGLNSYQLRRPTFSRQTRQLFRLLRIGQSLLLLKLFILISLRMDYDYASQSMGWHFLK